MSGQILMRENMEEKGIVWKGGIGQVMAGKEIIKC